VAVVVLVMLVVQILVALVVLVVVVLVVKLQQELLEQPTQVVVEVVDHIRTLAQQMVVLAVAELLSSDT